MSKRKASPQPVQQCELPLEDVFAYRLAWHRVLEAVRRYVRIETTAAVAGELEKVFAGSGHHVTEALLNNTLRETNSNYFRGEWLPYFCAVSQDVCDAVAAMNGQRRPTKTDRQLLDDVILTVTEELGKQGVAALQKAKDR